MPTDEGGRGRVARPRHEVFPVTGCTACGWTDQADASFCGACGQPLTAVCSRCGGVNPPANRFCQHCGAGLLAAPERFAPLAVVRAAARSYPR